MANGHGGKRLGAGRKPGTRNRRTKEQVEAVAKTGQTPLEYLTSIYQDESQEPARRIDAAKAAAPYVHARLSNVDMNVNEGSQRAEELPDAELNRIASSSSERTAAPQEGENVPPGVH